MMRRAGVVLCGVVMAVLSGAARAEAQIAWETPMLIGPGAPGGFGVYLMESTADELAVLGTYRTSPVPVGLGFRLGLGEEADEDIAVFGGVDVAGSLMSATEEVPIDVLWFAGAGVGIGGDVLLSFPLGLSVGAILDADQVRFAPYAAPRVVLDACLGDDDPPGGGACFGDDDLNLDVAADVGLDLSFSPSWTIRFAASLGDREALLIGVAFPR